MDELKNQASKIKREQEKQLDEKIFVDDKELYSYSKEDIYSQIKDKIINFQYLGENDDDKNKIEKEKKDDIKRQQNEKDRQ
jgi:hypothetical protein